MPAPSITVRPCPPGWLINCEGINPSRSEDLNNSAKSLGGLLLSTATQGDGRPSARNFSSRYCLTVSEVPGNAQRSPARSARERKLARRGCPMRVTILKFTAPHGHQEIPGGTALGADVQIRSTSPLCNASSSPWLRSVSMENVARGRLTKNWASNGAKEDTR
ncbi:hypothetical protein D3C81_1510880 [compost metagenome]